MAGATVLTVIRSDAGLNCSRDPVIPAEAEILPLTCTLPDVRNTTPVDPLSVNCENDGVSAVCNPVSTSVLTPLIVARTVPCDGEENTELDTVPIGNPDGMMYEAVTANDAVVILPLNDPVFTCSELDTSAGLFPTFTNSTYEDVSEKLLVPYNDPVIPADSNCAGPITESDPERIALPLTSNTLKLPELLKNMVIIRFPRTQPQSNRYFRLMKYYY